MHAAATNPLCCELPSCFTHGARLVVSSTVLEVRLFELSPRSATHVTL